MDRPAYLVTATQEGDPNRCHTH